VVILSQYLKALSPTDVTKLGMVTLVNPSQLKNEKSPIDSKLLGKVIPVKLVQPEKA